MIQVKFKNMESSELVRQTVIDRMGLFAEKFEDLKNCRLTVTLEMENSPTQAGPDVFKVKLYIANGRYRGTAITKADGNLYKALAEVVEHMLERLNRAGDKERVKERTQARHLVQELAKATQSQKFDVTAQDSH